MGKVAPGNWEDDHKYYTDKRTIYNKSKQMETQLKAIEDSEIQGEIRGQLQALQNLIENDRDNSNQSKIQEGRDNLKKVTTARDILSNIDNQSEINSNKELCTFAVQTLLRTKGYFQDLKDEGNSITAKDRIDAINGPKTKDALRKFQEDYNSTVDDSEKIQVNGKINDETIKALLKESDNVVEQNSGIDDPERREIVNQLINDLTISFKDLFKARNPPQNNDLISKYLRARIVLDEMSNNSQENQTQEYIKLKQSYERASSILSLGEEYTSIKNQIQQADQDNGFDQNWDEIKKTVTPQTMNDYREQINKIENIDISKYSSSLTSDDQNKLNTIIRDLNTQLHQKEKEYEAYRAEQIEGDSLIKKLLADANAINEAITNHYNEEINKEKYHFRKGEYRKGTQTLADILGSNKRPKIKSNDGEYMYQTSGNDFQTLEDKSQQYKAIVNAIEQGQSKSDIENNLNTLLYQEKIAEEPAIPSATNQQPATADGTEVIQENAQTPTTDLVVTEVNPQTTVAESNEGGKGITEDVFDTLRKKDQITAPEWDQIIDYANTHEANYLGLFHETIYPCNKLKNKNTDIKFWANHHTLNTDNIVNIAEITGKLTFRKLTIDSDIFSLNCEKLCIQDNLSIKNINNLNGFKKKLQICKCDLNSLPDISNLQCSELILGVPENFDINTISPQTLQYLSQYKGKFTVYTTGKYLEFKKDITEKVKKRMKKTSK